MVSKGGGGSGCDVAAAADAFDCSLCFVDVFCLFFFVVCSVVVVLVVVLVLVVILVVVLVVVVLVMVVTVIENDDDDVSAAVASSSISSCSSFSLTVAKVGAISFSLKSSLLTSDCSNSS